MRKIIQLLTIITMLFLLGGCLAPQVLWVGIAEDQTGSLSAITRELDQGRRLAQQMISQEKSGKAKLRFKTIDTLNSPEKTANAFRTLIDQHKVSLFLGVPSSECTQVAKHVAEMRQVPFISNAYDSSLLQQTSGLVVLRQNPSQLGNLTALYFFYFLKKNRLAVLYDKALLSTQQSSRGYLQEGRLIGATMLEESFSSFERPADWQVSWSKLQSANPEVVLVSADPSHYKDLLIIARRVLQVPAIFVLHHLPLKEDVENDPDLFDNVYLLLPFYDKKEKFISSSFYGQYLQRFNEKPSFYSAQGYDEVVFLHEIMMKRNSLPLSERFRNLQSYMAEKEKYLTGFRGFAEDGFSVHHIDVLKMSQSQVEYLGEFWMEILSKGSSE